MGVSPQQITKWNTKLRNNGYIKIIKHKSDESGRYISSPIELTNKLLQYKVDEYGVDWTKVYEKDIFDFTIDNSTWLIN